MLCLDLDKRICPEEALMKRKLQGKQKVEVCELPEVSWALSLERSLASLKDLPLLCPPISKLHWEPRVLGGTLTT